MLGDSALCTGYGFHSRYGGGRQPEVARHIRPFFAGADLVFGNLECVLSGRHYSSRLWSAAQMRSTESFAEHLRSAGFNVLNVANNHATQHGHEAFVDTVNAVTRAGITVCGLRGAGEWGCAPAIVTHMQRSICFLAYCLRPRQYSNQEPPYAEGPPEIIRADVARAAGSADHVIVSLHWGEEYVNWPSSSEVSFARSLIDAGAHAIIGHHPHVARPVELYANGVIAYSLGNFASDMIWLDSLRKGLMVTIALDAAAPPTVQARGVYIAPDYLPQIIDSADWVEVKNDVAGMAEAEYERQTNRTIQQSRRASYGYVARRAASFRFPTQVHLGLVTLRNKLTAIARGSWRAMTT